MTVFKGENMDTYTWKYVGSIEDMYNLRAEKNRITFIEPLNHLAKVLKNGFELWSDLFQEALQTHLGLKKEIARLITHFFSTLVSMYEIGRLSIVGAETTKLKMTANTASVTA
ncbi:hypothetical protein HRED_06340 [Candidatus Haloredivivus sp. G17]|nr:hypothetical protein HRED_03414 [Candidatus Haloredivivus sp. G17]EHK01919.1 hypothetical protein HRED_06340 [Candidatus Haloredivivus sp. G17]